MLVRMWGRRNPNPLLVGMEISATPGENSMEAPQKTKNGTTINPVILLLAIYLKECKSGYNKDMCTPIFIAALFIIAKLWKQPRCLTTGKWIKKCGTYIQWSIIHA
jgi:hypothetical protein